MNNKTILLINLGTPDAPTTAAVRTYLHEFLHDPRVIDIHPFLRNILVNGLILPFRSKKSAAAYEKVWTPAGSPLLVNTKALQDALQGELGENYNVVFAMRYGKPSIAATLQAIPAHHEIIVLPLFPQYSSAATGSVLEKFYVELNKRWNMPSIKVQHDFYNDPGFINAYASLIASHLAKVNVDKIVFSYHGLPERHIDKSECKASCDHVTACPKIDLTNAYCYRAQCYETTRLIATKLNLQANQYVVSFQSRLGRSPWIKPYTDFVLPDLRKEGCQSIAMVCPSFVADCLETLEEVNIRTREQWLALGGQAFTFIPCLNAQPDWVLALANMIKALA